MSSRKCFSSVKPDGSDQVSIGQPSVLNSPNSRTRSRAKERGCVNGTGWLWGWKFSGVAYSLSSGASARSLKRMIPVSPATRSTTGLTEIGTTNQSLQVPGRSVWREPATSIVALSPVASIRKGTSRRRAIPRSARRFSACDRACARAAPSSPRAASSTT